MSKFVRRYLRRFRKGYVSRGFGSPVNDIILSELIDLFGCSRGMNLGGEFSNAFRGMANGANNAASYIAGFPGCN